MSRIRELIPKDELRERLRDLYCELELDFLCFEDSYLAVRDAVPETYEIVDLGCYMAAQSYLFGKFAKYTGVDSYDLRSRPEYIPPKRFAGPPNTEHVSADIADFCRRMQGKDLSKTYAVMSFVPVDEATKTLVKATFPNLAIFYCDEAYTQGVCADAVAKLRYRYYRSVDFNVKG